MVDEFVAAHCAGCGAVLPLGDAGCPVCGASDRFDTGSAGFSDAVDQAGSGTPGEVPSRGSRSFARRLVNVALWAGGFAVLFWVQPLFAGIALGLAASAIVIGLMVRLFLEPTVMEALVLSLEGALAAAVERGKHEVASRGTRAVISRLRKR